MNIAIFGERHVERFGSYEALVFGEQVRTNAASLERSARVAGGLRAAGVGEGDRVAVLAPNSLDIGVTYGAVARIGGVTVPVIFLLAVPEITHILRDAAPKAIVTSPEFLANVRAACEPLDDPPAIVVIGGDGTDGSIAFDALADAEPVPIVERAASDLAVISYTSGTTGRPKGVMLTHGNLAFQAENTATVAPLQDGDVSLACLPLAHLFGLGNTLVAQLFRIKGVVLEWFTPQGFFDAIERHRVTSTALVPTMLSLMMADPGFDDVDWSSLRYTVIGAAPLAPEVAEEFSRRTGVRVLQGYGLTETSPAVSLASLDDPYNGSAGRPLPNIEVQIRGEDGAVLGPGEVGEIVVRGPNVMAGYYGLPDETSEAIVDGWFHTGDVGALDADGYLFITDRVKDLIIRGGFNIYPSDVEAVLYEHPAVLECGVVGVPDPTMGEEVVAFVVLMPGSEASAEELIGHARANLATYKAPRHLSITDALPKNAVGKIMRRELRERAARDRAEVGDLR